MISNVHTEMYEQQTCKSEYVYHMKCDFVTLFFLLTIVFIWQVSTGYKKIQYQNVPVVPLFEQSDHEIIVTRRSAKTVKPSAGSTSAVSTVASVRPGRGEITTKITFCKKRSMCKVMPSPTRGEVARQVGKFS